MTLDILLLGRRRDIYEELREGLLKESTKNYSD